MHISKFIPMLIAFALLYPNLVSAQQNQDLFIIASLDKLGFYHSGDHLNLTIFSYLGETPADLDAIFVNFTDIYGGNPISLNCTRADKGKYIVEYVITQEDSEKRFVVTGLLGTFKKTIYVSLPFESPTAVYLSFPEKNSTSVLPGEQLKVYVECYNNTQFIEPANITLFVEYGEKQNLNLSRLSIGRYAGNFTVPVLNKSTEFVFTAAAIINGKTESRSVSMSYMPVHVWYHAIRITEQSASFDLGICEPDGRGLANTTLELQYSTDYSEWKKVTGKTNGDGVVHFYIAPDVVFTPYIYIKGFLGENNSTEFQFSIPLIAQQRPSSGFDVCIENSSYANQTIEIMGRAYNNTLPLANSTLLYFLKNWGAMHGKVDTDENGFFTIEMRGIEPKYIHPYFGITMIFAMANNTDSVVEKIAWLNTFPQFYLDSNLSLEIANFSFGGMASLSLSTQKTFLCPMLQPFVALYEGDFSSQSWIPLLAPVYFIPHNITTMVCTFPLPNFCYTGQKNVTVCGLYYETSTFIPHMATKKSGFEAMPELHLRVLIEGEDYFVIEWDKYPHENFLNYEILVANETGEFVSIANITDKNITQYRITSMGGETLKGETNYTIKLRVYFSTANGVIFAEEVVSARTLPAIPGFTAFEVLVVLIFAVLLFVLGRRL